MTKIAPMVLTFVAWAIPGLLSAQPRPDGPGWGMHPMWWSTWGFGMMIMMVLFWGLLIVGAIVGIRWFLGQGKEPKSDSAMEILRQRYARGEIDKEEFETKKKDLT